MAAVAVYFPDEMLEAVDAAAAAEGLNRSQYVVRAVSSFQGGIDPKLRRQLAKALAKFVRDDLVIPIE